MRSQVKRVLAGGFGVALFASVLAVAAGSGTPAGAGVATAFTITVNNSSSAAVPYGSAATLTESGLPDDATGTVTFATSLDPDLCTATLPAPQCTSPVTLTPGNYQVTASYSGDDNYDASASTNTVSLTITAATTTVVTASPSSAAYGTPITFTATVTSANSMPTGTVNFRTASKGLCSATLSGGTASCSATTAPIGTTVVSGLYVGDGTSGRSIGKTTITVFRGTAQLTCAKLSGKVAGTIKFGLCTPFSIANRTATAPGSFLTSGGTLTWMRSFETSVVTLTSTSPGQGACPKKNVEYDLTGQVTGGTSGYTLQDDSVSIQVCESARTGAVHLLAGTQAEL